MQTAIAAIHQIWVGSPLPDHLAAQTRTWQHHHPDWPHRIWTEADIDELGLVNRDLYNRAPDLVPADAVGQFRADIARYEILYRHGGVYADLDTTCQRPIASLLDPDRLNAAWEVQGQWIGNTVLAAPRWHRALAAIVYALPRIVRAEAPARPNRLSGPRAITPILRGRADVRLLHQSTFYPVPWNEAERSDTEAHAGAYVVHHWQHQRTLRGLPPAKATT